MKRNAEARRSRRGAGRFLVDAEMLKTEILKAGRGGNKEGRKAGRRDWCRVKGFASRDWEGVINFV
jgi:hypothetical protein